MKKVLIEGRLCVGPNFTEAEFTLIKRNLARQKGLDTLANSLDASGNVQRLKILYLLHVHVEMCVCDLAEILGLTDSAVSQHLSKLKDKGIVTNRRQGQTILYSLVTNTFTIVLTNLFGKNEMKQEYLFLKKELA